jgi:hypothetical protein
MDTQSPATEDAALIAILSEQIGTLNALVSRYRLRERIALNRAERAEQALADARDAQAQPEPAFANADGEPAA